MARLRPFSITTIAFVAGIAPLIVSTGIGAGFNRATAAWSSGARRFVASTLLATPVAYSLFDDLTAWLKRRGGRVAAEDGSDELDALDSLVGQPAGH